MHFQSTCEYRLLNSLLVSLVTILDSLCAMWNIVVYVAAAGEGDADFSDAGTAPAQQTKRKKKVVKLMQRQKKAQPKLSKLSGPPLFQTLHFQI